MATQDRQQEQKQSFLLCLLTIIVMSLINLCESKGSRGSAFHCVHNEGTRIKVRLIDDDSYPYVEARCSGNGYLIIDVNNDENWLSYFSSQRLFHHNLLGPSKDDIVNWDEWFLPSMRKYLVSPDCNICDEDELLNENYGTQSSYYMMAVMDGCTQLPIGRIGCDMDYHTYECRVCGTKKGRPDGYWVNMPVYNGLNMDKVEDGSAIIFNEKEDYVYYRYGLCGFTIRDAMAPHHKHNDTFEHCKRVTHEDTNADAELIIPRRKPSLGTGGNFCVCAKPHTNDFYQVFKYDEDALQVDKTQSNSYQSRHDNGEFEGGEGGEFEGEHINNNDNDNDDYYYNGIYDISTGNNNDDYVDDDDDDYNDDFNDGILIKPVFNAHSLNMHKLDRIEEIENAFIDEDEDEDTDEYDEVNVIDEDSDESDVIGYGRNGRRKERKEPRPTRRPKKVRKRDGKEPTAPTTTDEPWSLMTSTEYIEQGEGENEEEGKKLEKDRFRFVRLYQSDFEKGTYRIFHPGKYIIMEDIVFDFNAPKGYEHGLDTYNADGMWWPTTNQVFHDTKEQKYPGAGSLKEAFFMGFYAGISVECIDEKGVIIDLNGHTLEMSKAFFYQQSFFAIIALSGQTFLPGQGPGFFGATPIMAKHVEIRNGKLGLSSHHGIQGNLNEDIYIHDVEITQFKTHGIQLNGFKDVVIKNVNVHHNRVVDKLSPFFAHMRHYLPIHRMMAEDLENQGKENICIRFNNRINDGELTKIYSIRHQGKKCVTYADMIESMEILLDMAFEFAYFDKTERELKHDKTLKIKKLWDINKHMIINSNRHYHTWTATMYGIFLNYVGSNVIGWYAGSPNVKSRGITMQHIKIHHLYHDTQENVAFSQGRHTGKQRLLNCLNAPFNAYHIFGEEQVNQISVCNMYGDEHPDYDPVFCDDDTFRPNLQYQGNLATDIQLATFYLINEHGMSWNYCAGGAADLDALVQFAMHGTPWFEGTPLLAASHDPMIHPGKGVLGLRLNGVDQAHLSHISIDNIISDTRLGTLIANSYDFVVSQQKPYMRGFSMNMVNGLTVTMCDEMILDNIHIQNIKSATGLAYGLAIWYQTSLTMKTKILVENVIAGDKLIEDALFVEDILNDPDYLPNVKPESCPFRLFDDDNRKITLPHHKYSDKIDEILHINCVQGYSTCDVDINAWDQLGLTAYYKMDGVYTPCNEHSPLGGSMDIINLPDLYDDDEEDQNDDNSVSIFESLGSTLSSLMASSFTLKSSIPEDDPNVIISDNEQKKEKASKSKNSYSKNENEKEKVKNGNQMGPKVRPGPNKGNKGNKVKNGMMNVGIVESTENDIDNEKPWVKFVVAGAAVICMLISLSMVWKEMKKQEKRKNSINIGVIDTFGTIGVIGMDNSNDKEIDDKGLLDNISSDEQYIAV